MKHVKIIVFTVICLVSLSVLAEKQKDRTKILETFGYCYYKKGLLANSIEEYERVLDIDKQNYRSYYNLGVLYAIKGDYIHAIKKLKDTIKPESRIKGDSLYNLSVIYGKYLKDTEKGYKYYKLYYKDADNTN